MLTTRVAIVGGGLGGLYAAALLEARGLHDYVLLEARATFGGRILSVPASTGAGLRTRDGAPEAGRHDLGATWLWPALQPGLQRLVDALGLETLGQYEDGDLLIEPGGTDVLRRVAGYRSVPAARRIAGGMQALTDALHRRLTTANLRSGCRVKALRQLGESVEVTAEDASGRMFAWRAGHVLLAVPPRLAVHTIDFAPALPDTLARQWQRCATWMAPHAKYVAVFDRPFWREHGLSGAAHSVTGPLAEIHDASAPGGGAALFGFAGIPAAVRSRIPDAELLARCRAQLVRLFGDDASSPRAEFLKDWASDPYTAIAADWQPGVHEAGAPSSTVPVGSWRNRLIGIASEWSPAFSGYAAGAVDAAQRGIATLLATDTAGTPS